MKKVVKKTVEPKKVEPKIVIFRPKVSDPYRKRINEVLDEITIALKNESSVEIIDILNDCLRNIQNNKV